MSGNSSPKKVPKIRTFHSDVSILKGEPAPNSSTPAKSKETSKINEQKKLNQNATIFRKPTKEEIKTITAEPEPEKKMVTIKPVVAQIIEQPVPIIQENKPLISSSNKTLQEETQGFLQEKTGSRSLVENPLMNTAQEINTYDDSDDYGLEGSIISDKKDNRFRLFSAIADAVKYWFNEEKTAIEIKAENRRKAIPTVRSIEERKEIVEKASRQSALAPKDDYKKLASKIPTNKPTETGDKEVATKSVSIKEKKEIKPSWSHFDAPASEFKINTKEIATPTKEILQTPKSTPVIPILPEKESTQPAIIHNSIEIPVTETTTPISVSKPEIIEPAPADPIVNKAEPKENNIRNFGQLNQLAIYSAIALVIIIASSGGVFGVWWFINLNKTTTPVTSNPTNLPVSTNPTTAPTYETNNINISGISTDNFKQQIQSTGSQSDFVIFNLTTNNSIIANTEEILRAVNIQVSGSFTRNIEKITIAKYQNNPLIIIKFSSFDTAFGGILSAESGIINNLGVFDSPQSNSTTTPNAIGFADQIVQNHDVRVLQYDNGEEGITYGFTNQRILIIANNKESFINSIERAQ